MKNILLLVVLLTLISCENKKEECKYISSNVPIDTSLFISYSFKNIDYRFFQVHNEDWTGYSISNTFTKINGQTIWSHNYPFFFGDLNLDGTQGNLNLKMVLTFYDTTLQGEYLGIIHQRALRKRLHSNYRFTIPKKGPASGITEFDLADTVFLRGISLSMNNYEYSTDSLISHYKYNIDSLSKFLWNESYFKIEKNVNVCDYYKLIEGEFTTSLMNGYDKKLEKIEKGRFRILVDK
jgi:hypothetical protein